MDVCLQSLGCWSGLSDLHADGEANAFLSGRLTEENNCKDQKLYSESRFKRALIQLQEMLTFHSFKIDHSKKKKLYFLTVKAQSISVHSTHAVCTVTMAGIERIQLACNVSLLTRANRVKPIECIWPPMAE